MNDRALLEAAARAAGIKWVERGDGYWLHANGETRSWWNPLTDDGDALRLAVKLRIDLTFIPSNERGDSPLVNACFCEGRTLMEATEEGFDEAATRRAIVRAAAAIGSERG